MTSPALTHSYTAGAIPTTIETEDPFDEENIKNNNINNKSDVEKRSALLRLLETKKNGNEFRI